MNLRKLFLLALVASAMSCSNISLAVLKVDYQITPLGIDNPHPQFSWRMEGTGDPEQLTQIAYQVEVSDEAGKVVWDSGKVESGESVGIRYAGESLEATTKYTWTARVWTEEGKEVQQSSWFETGLFDPDPSLSAWDGATWIGGDTEDMVLQSHYLSVFKVQYQLQLDAESESTSASFLLGANDQRLMDKDLNLGRMAVGQDESYIAIELDIKPLSFGGTAQLNVFRVGYTATDKLSEPLHVFSISKNLINLENQYDAHQFYIESVFGMMQIFLNGQAPGNKVTEDEPGTGFGQRGINLNPYGRGGGDFICFPMLADIGFKLDKGQSASFGQIEIRNYRQPSNPLFTEDLSSANHLFKAADNSVMIRDAAYYLVAGEEDLLVTADPSRNAAPMLRTTFTADNKPIQKARIYATARGIYELYLNGERVGEDYFNPGLTQYNKTHLYQTYDVTDMVRKGSENAVGAWLSEGWWSGNITFRGENWNYFGDRQSLLAKLVITYQDGTQSIVTTNEQDWKLFTDGPIRYGSFFQGEVYDANKEEGVNGWATPAYDDESWKAVVQVPLAGTSVMGSFNDFRGLPKALPYDEQKIRGQFGENVRVVETLTAQSVEEVRPGVFVYDMGQNMVGVPSIRLVDGKKGAPVRLRFAEVRYPDLTEYDGNTGMIMLENIRAALTQDLYITKGGDETIQPRFTFHGYRFIEITGIDEALPIEQVKGLVLSSVNQLASHYETSNALVNKLWENITWSLRGNFLSIPTDTPARNERMGWNGDINVFSRAATWLTDANQFLKRHLRAMRDMQADNGRFSDVAPVGNGFGGTLWGSAGIVVAWETYRQYGDLSLLEEHYEAMKSYVQFLASKQNEVGVLVEGPLGDWLSPENGKNDNTLLWTAYQVHNLAIMQEVAKLLGKTAEAEEFGAQLADRKAFFNATYVHPETGKTVHSGVIARGFGPPNPNPPKKGDEIDTQASYAIPLAFGVFEEKYQPLAIEHLAQAISRKNTDDLGVERPPYSLMTGFIGTASIGEALSENSHDELAYQLLQTETYPSWLYPVKNGATTIWERLNSYTIENGFGGNNSMNSFNHYSFGAIAAWMYNYSLGIQRHPDYPGFKQFILQPTPDPSGQMTYAKGHYDSMYGRIISEWYLEDGGTRFRFVVPPNTGAELYLPVKEGSTIEVKGKAVEQIDSIREEDKEGGKKAYRLGAGTYEFWLVDK